MPDLLKYGAVEEKKKKKKKSLNQCTDSCNLSSILGGLEEE